MHTQKIRSNVLFGPHLVPMVAKIKKSKGLKKLCFVYFFIRELKKIARVQKTKKKLVLDNYRYLFIYIYIFDQ